MNSSEALSVARQITRKVGDLLASQAGIHTMQFKGLNDPVTLLDRQSEELITKQLKISFPDHGIVAEEGTLVNAEEKYRWVIDPLDGTTNYAHGLPYFSVSIALVCDGEPMIGVVRAPLLSEEFYAWKGGGAYLNGKKIHVSKEKNLERGFLATGEPYDIRENLDYHLGLFGKIVMKALAVRRFGSASLDLCNLACGKYDGYWESGLKPWDAAAGMLILEEAGGKVSDYLGNEYVLGKSTTILATNALIHDEMVKTLSA